MSAVDLGAVHTFYCTVFCGTRFCQSEPVHFPIWSRKCDRDWEIYISRLGPGSEMDFNQSPHENGMGPYLVLGLSKVLGMFPLITHMRPRTVVVL